MSQIRINRPIYDIIGPRTANVPAPMYSYERPSRILWQAVYDALTAEGCTHDQAIDWLQSTGPRYALDGEIGEKIRKVGLALGRECAKDAKESTK